MNEENEADPSLYIVIYPHKQEGAFTISKAGKYYYINTKALFDNLRVDYINEYVAFNISEQSIDNQRIFRFERRERIEKDQ